MQFPSWSRTSRKVLALLALTTSPLTGQTLLKDIEGGPAFAASSNPDNLTSLNGGVIFSAAEFSVAGLWWTDGSAQNTLHCSELRATKLVPVGGYAIGAVRGDPSNANATELLRTDGTETGTWTLPNPGLAEIEDLVQAGTEAAALLYFQSSTSPRLEVWATDGSLGRTRLIGTFPAVGASQTGRSLAFANGHLFATVETSTGWELWSTLGTTSAFQVIAQLGSPSQLTTVGDRLVFSASDAFGDVELWTSDGTSAGTYAIDLDPGPSSSSPSGFVVHEGLAYFRAQTTSSGVELWVTDGTSANTREVADINPGPDSSDPVFAGGLNGEVIFSASAGGALNLYAGSASSGVRVLFAGARVYSPGAQLGGELIFGAQAFGGAEPWKTDGTGAGTGRVADIIPGFVGSAPAGFTDNGSELLFHAKGPDGDREVWATNGTFGGTREVIDLTALSNGGSSPILRGKLGDRAFFTAYQTGTGKELWVTDGTASGTQLFVDLVPGTSSHDLDQFQFAEGFFTFSSAGSRATWASDGTVAGTRLILPARATLTSARTASNEILLGSFDQLWITNGSPAGTRLLQQLPSSQRVVSDMTEWNDLVFYTGSAPSGDPGVWVTDGTQAGTRSVWDPATSGHSLHVSGGLAGLGSEVYFRVVAGSDLELWATDGSNARRVDTLAPELGYLSSKLLAAGDKLFFFHGAGPGTKELLAYDSMGGVRSLTSLSSLPRLFESTATGRVVFSEYGLELWASDGYPAGTQLIRALGTTPATISKSGTPGATTLLFTTGRFSQSREWITDGTGLGTFEPNSGSATDIGVGLRLGSQYLYKANDPSLGAELFSRQLSSVGDYAVETYGWSCGSPLNIALEGEPRASAALPLAVALTGAPAHAPALLFWSPARGSAKLGSCFIGLAGPLSLISTSTDLNGEARVSFAPSPAIVDLKLDFQYAVFDPAGPLNGFSVSAALEIVGGP